LAFKIKIRVGILAFKMIIIPLGLKDSKPLNKNVSKKHVFFNKNLFG
jgi:hypothetical protein